MRTVISNRHFCTHLTFLSKQTQRETMVFAGDKSIQFHSPVDFKSLPVDCRNFIAQRAAMLYCLFLW